MSLSNLLLGKKSTALGSVLILGKLAHGLVHDTLGSSLGVGELGLSGRLGLSKLALGASLEISQLGLGSGLGVAQLGRNSLLSVGELGLGSGRGTGNLGLGLVNGVLNGSLDGSLDGGDLGSGLGLQVGNLVGSSSLGIGQGVLQASKERGLVGGDVSRAGLQVLTNDDTIVETANLLSTRPELGETELLSKHLESAGIVTAARAAIVVTSVEEVVLNGGHDVVAGAVRVLTVEDLAGGKATRLADEDLGVGLAIAPAGERTTEGLAKHGGNVGDDISVVHETVEVRTEAVDEGSELFVTRTRSTIGVVGMIKLVTHLGEIGHGHHSLGTTEGVASDEDGGVGVLRENGAEASKELGTNREVSVVETRVESAATADGVHVHRKSVDVRSPGKNGVAGSTREGKNNALLSSLVTNEATGGRLGEHGDH